MSGNDVVVALTPGDPWGVGPEVAARAARGWTVRGASLVMYGPASVLETLDYGPWEARLVPEPPFQRPPRPGPSAWGGRIAMESLEAAVRDAMAGGVSAIVTGPVSKQSMHLAGWRYPGQTECLASLTGASHVAMMMANGCHRVVLATRHLPLRAVSSSLSIEGLVRLMALTHRELSAFLGRPPRLLVCGLNPHAGDGGLLGDEEQTLIAPAVREAVAEGCAAEGPVSAEEAFRRWGHDADIVIAMYHDQGVLPVKLLGLGGAVNVTLGLPIVRTSPGHGTAYSLAGTGKASEASMRAAMHWAVALARRRKA